MKSEKTHSLKEAYAPDVAVMAALQSSTLDAWNRRPKARFPVPPLTAEEYYRMIELAAEHQAGRHRVTPEFDLRDWLDAEEEVKSH